MNNREILNTYIVTNKLHVDFNSISKVEQYHLEELCNSRVEVRLLLDLVVDKMIDFETFISLGSLVSSNLQNSEDCESSVYSVANTIKNLSKYLDKPRLNKIVYNMMYAMSTGSCADYEDVQKILKRATIVDLLVDDKLKLNNVSTSVHNIRRGNKGLSYFELDTYMESNICVITIKKDKVEIYDQNDIKDKLHKYVLLSTMIMEDDFDIWLQAKDASEEQLISDIVNNKRFR